MAKNFQHSVVLIAETALIMYNLDIKQALEVSYVDKMKKIPKITQENVHIFIPCKVAIITKRISADRGIPLNKALVTFYNSRTYACLEKENTKLWHESPTQLYLDFVSTEK